MTRAPARPAAGQNAIVWLVDDPKKRYGMKVHSVGKSSGVRVVPVSSALVLQGKSEEQE